MKDASRPISLGLFVLVLLCFLLPFARISCRTEEGGEGGKPKTVTREVVLQATGYEVAFGKKIPAKSDAESWEPEARKPDFLAIAVLVATLVGMGLVLVKGRRGAITRALHSDHCMLLVVALWAELSIRVYSRAGELKMLAGFWATFALFAGACVINLLFIRRLRPQPADSG